MDEIEPCRLAPAGWYCSLQAGHSGPCPAWPKRRQLSVWLRRAADWLDGPYSHLPYDPRAAARFLRATLRRG